ncbi:MAG: hypothetical protein XD69_0485, partial [Clostridia bacterium 62_21]
MSAKDLLILFRVWSHTAPISPGHCLPEFPNMSS